METSGEIIGIMRAAVPAGQQSLSEDDLGQLRDLTQSLRQVKPEASAEHARFLEFGRRGLWLRLGGEFEHWLAGATILVTGGTGCIGSTLMRQLARQNPKRLASVSRGVTTGWMGPAGAEYFHADVRDRAAVGQLIESLRPDVIFHVAAQRSPALAELEVHRTVSTNVLGTRNVLAAAAAAGVRQVVCASTGKALRPYSPEIYTASKRAAEWIGASAAANGLLCSAARFTHVRDNSIIYRRLLEWAGGGVVRLHGAEIGFYVQSALESAQLLLVAALGSQPGRFRVHAITDLGWPISLLDLALGVLAETGSDAPIYFSGYDPGYEEVPFPGLYDPLTAGDVSPLLNAFETAVYSESPCPMVDAFTVQAAADQRLAPLLAGLDEVCARTQEPGPVRAALDELSWALLDASLCAASPQALARAASLTNPHQHLMPQAHRRVLWAIQQHAMTLAGSDRPAV